MQDIKSQAISENQIDELARMSGSYESLFSRKALKFRSMGLHEQPLKEKDYRRLILEEYTFLKRPVVVIDGEIFIGNSKSAVEEAKKKMKG